MPCDPLVVILARGGSKRIKKKCLQQVGRTSLLINAINLAFDAGLHPSVSSENTKILKIAQNAGAQIIPRPECYATDTATSVSASIHACGHSLRFSGSLILLQVTNPLLHAKDIMKGYSLHLETKKQVFGAKKFPQALQAWSHAAPLFPRFQEQRSQDLPPCFLPCGSYFITDIHRLTQTKSFFSDAIPCEVPFDRAIDIDTPRDLEYARFLWAKRRRL